MRKLGIMLAVATFVALIVIAIANAFTASGSTVYSSNGAAFSGARVSIWSYQNGSGSTFSDSNGTYTFGGLVSGQQYFLSATGCKSHTAYTSQQVEYFGSGGLPTLRLVVTGSC